MFFEKDENAKIIAEFLRKADASHVDDEHRAKRLAISRDLLGYIYKSPAEWDKRCSFNIKNIGDQFLEWLRDFDYEKANHIDHIYCMAYRFLCEFDFLIGVGRELSMELRSIKNRIQHDDGDMGEDVRSQIIYASYVMPANIAKDFINDANIAVFKDFEQKKNEAENLKKKWDEEIQSKESTANALKDRLEQYKVGFNFVGLYQGFSDLADKKQKEAFWLFWSLIGMGTLILAPLIFEVGLASKGVFDGKV